METTSEELVAFSEIVHKERREREKRHVAYALRKNERDMRCE